MAGPSASAIAAAIDARPRLRVEPDELTAFLRDTVLPRHSQPCLDEVVVIFAALHGQTAGLRALEREYLRPAASALASMGLDAHVVDELLQLLREKMLVARDGNPAKLESYAGSGRVKGLLRVALARLAVDRIRSEGRPIGIRSTIDLETVLANAPAGEKTADDELIDEARRQSFVKALEIAVARITPRQRSLLRLHVLDGVTLEQLARSYRVHRATIVRWIARARQDVLETTRVEMARSLRLSEDELGSLPAAVISQLDLSLKRLFASHQPPT